MDNRHIGVFDSGLGGITVLEELQKYLPQERYIFLADTYHSPYGDKSLEELEEIVNNNIVFLLSKGVKLIVVACNTASTLDIDKLRAKYNIPIITVLEATLDEISDQDKKILIAATENTIKSEKHKKLIKEKFPDAIVDGIACKSIVPSIEFHDLTYEQAQNVVDRYILPFSGNGYNAIVLGCTHYPIWEEHFTNVLPDTRSINPAENTAKITRDFLEKHNMLVDERTRGTSDDYYYVTSDMYIFTDKVRKIFSKNLKNVEKI